MKHIVVDIDNTLSDARHRQHLAQAKQWQEFHTKAIHDNPWTDVKEFLGLLPRDVPVLGLTGRPEIWRPMTIEWMVWHKIARFDDLLMRPDDNFDPDTVIKPRMLFEYFGGEDKARESVMMILEDRDVVVERWRELGFNCWQVRASGY